MPRQSRRSSGAGYLMPQEYYDTSFRQPSGPEYPTISAAPVTGWVRPPISATNVIAPAGGRRSSSRRSSSRRNKSMNMKGGFAAEIMGAFAANAQSAVVPLALLTLYSVFGAKKTPGPNSTRKSNGPKSNGSKSNGSKSKHNNA